jgi:hypothetical protein
MSKIDFLEEMFFGRTEKSEENIGFIVALKMLRKTTICI